MEGNEGEWVEIRTITPYYARHLFSHVISEIRPTTASMLALKKYETESGDFY